MRAMVLAQQGQPLEMRQLNVPEPGLGQVRIAVSACGVCRTDLHVVDGDLAQPKLPLVPGHEIVGRVDALGAGVTGLTVGQRVGVPWLGHACCHCPYCRRDAENLCDDPLFTGYTIDGGYAEMCVADAHFVLPLPSGGKSDAELAPLLCAGLIGYRSLKMAGQGQDEAERLGIFGFGAAAHILAQVAVWQGQTLAAFTRPGDGAAQQFARDLGAEWAGGSDEPAPFDLDAAIIFAPVGSLVPAALRAVRKGGTVVCGGIHMSDIPAFPYSILWGERRVVSVANLTRQDGLEFLEIAAQAGVETAVSTYPLAEASTALDDLRDGRLTGAAVLLP